MKTDIHFIQKSQSEYVSFLYELNPAIEKLASKWDSQHPYYLAQEPNKDGVFLIKEKLFKLEKSLKHMIMSGF
ncbi:MULTISPECIES: hypothetical protein [Bacillus]|uniref:hypothetical protein n=1 Tax=Bacillus TaxID=1386 RepID=UPI0021A592DB|nr:hypothetical protein [Bacillus pumilus]WHX45510.1 hypothetical protein QNH35_03150 [Bacillus pumilus]WOP21379.1 hypothetical protein R0I01_15725 [Bacillus pumilus]